jgi:hypothetical protein
MHAQHKLYELKFLGETNLNRVFFFRVLFCICRSLLKELELVSDSQRKKELPCYIMIFMLSSFLTSGFIVFMI